MWKCLNITYQIILCWLSVANDYKHFIIDILIWYRLAILISRSLLHKGVILNLEASILLSYYDHRLCIMINILRICSHWYKFNIVLYSQNFASRLSFDIFLGYILGLIVKKTMRVPGPSDAAHVNLIQWLLLLLYLLCTDLLIKIVLNNLILNHLYILLHRHLFCRRALL